MLDAALPTTTVAVAAPSVAVAVAAAALALAAAAATTLRAPLASRRLPFRGVLAGLSLHGRD